MRRMRAAAVVAAVLVASGCGGVDRPASVAWLPQPRDFHARAEPCEELALARDVNAAIAIFAPDFSECWAGDDAYRFLAADSAKLAFAIEEASGGVLVGEPLGTPDSRTFCRPTLLTDEPRRVDGYTVSFVCTAAVEYRGDQFAPMSVTATGWVTLDDAQLALLRDALGAAGWSLGAPVDLEEAAVKTLKDANFELVILVYERDS